MLCLTSQWINVTVKWERPADERVTAPLSMFSAVDSDITGSLDDWHSPGRDDSRYPRECWFVCFGGAASWRPCNVAYPHQGLVPHS